MSIVGGLGKGEKQGNGGQLFELIIRWKKIYYLKVV